MDFGPSLGNAISRMMRQRAPATRDRNPASTELCLELSCVKGLGSRGVKEGYPDRLHEGLMVGFPWPDYLTTGTLLPEDNDKDGTDNTYYLKTIPEP